MHSIRQNIDFEISHYPIAWYIKLSLEWQSS